jgi:DNA polymerase-3 subunit epsilon
VGNKNNKAKQTALIFDTETTGLVYNHVIKIDRQPEVIEFYGQVVSLSTGKVYDKYHTLVCPKKFPMDDYTIKATKTKLTNEMLKDAPIFKDVANEIRNFFEESSMIIAHNLSFDMEMIDLEYERLKGQLINWPLKRICTVEATLFLKGKRLTLTDLHTLLFGDVFENAHRAETDVAALTRCVVELHRRDLI